LGRRQRIGEIVQRKARAHQRLYDHRARLDEVEGLGPAVRTPSDAEKFNLAADYRSQRVPVGLGGGIADHRYYAATGDDVQGDVERISGTGRLDDHTRAARLGQLSECRYWVG